MVKRHFGKTIATWVAIALILLNWHYGFLFDGDYLLNITIGLYFGLIAWSVYDAYNSETDFK